MCLNKVVLNRNYIYTWMSFGQQFIAQSLVLATGNQKDEPKQIINFTVGEEE